jgi:hypothetical protein
MITIMCCGPGEEDCDDDLFRIVMRSEKERLAVLCENDEEIIGQAKSETTAMWGGYAEAKVRCQHVAIYC